jgi:hypothetical protein
VKFEMPEDAVSEIHPVNQYGDNSTMMSSKLTATVR